MSALPVIMPTEVSDVSLVFPGDVRHLMPAFEEIPEQFTSRDNVWNQFTTDLLFTSMDGLGFHMVPGVDGETAFRHVRAIAGSHQPKHEHKEAAIAYLSSLWFAKVFTDKRTYEN